MNDIERLKSPNLRLNNGYILSQGTVDHNAFAVLEATKENNVALYALLHPMQKEIEAMKETFMFSNTKITPYSRCDLNSLGKFKEAFDSLGSYGLENVGRLIKISPGELTLYEYGSLKGFDKKVLTKMYPSSIDFLSDSSFYMDCDKELKAGFDKFCSYVNHESKNIIIEGAKALIKEDMPFYEIVSLSKKC